ncbi:MAG TPA: M28 family peptidase, partial [Acidimicrobiales bacterium]
MRISRSSSRRPRPRLALALLSAAALLAAAPTALATHDQPPADISKMDYTPIGKYGPVGQNVLAPGQTPSPTIPATTAPIEPTMGTYPGAIFNPSGKWVAYDSDVFVSINYPDRHPDDPAENTESDPAKDIPVGGSVTYGTCPPRPGFGPWGDCGNHAREYREYFEATMKEVLKDFGVQIKRYPFYSPGTGTPRGQFISGSEGDAMNIMAVVPGTDHPDENVVVSGHYDFTDSGPAAAWDSSEGHQEVIRMAAIMADYWRKTGTRPSATVKFAPWDSEESGTFGSIDYTQNNIPPGEADKVRGYFNVDPCAGAYPAARRGVGDRVQEVLQLADPSSITDADVKARVEKFNERAETIVDDVFNNLDDTVGGTKVFISDEEAEAGEGDSQRPEVVTALGGLAAFSSDYANFEGLGIPIFNLFPDYFGPHADGTPASAEGVSILHTNNDNLKTINGLTSPDQSGMTASEGWAKGMEMCAQMESWYMLQPEMGGAQRVAPDRNPIVAYYEALPNEVEVGKPVKFDGNGSYQFADVAAHSYVPDSELTYEWDFGDGQTGTGKVVEHSYADSGKYQSKLTVRRGDQSATMELPITVEPSNLAAPVLEAINKDEAADGTFPLKWTFDGETEGLQGFAIEESRN